MLTKKVLLVAIMSFVLSLCPLLYGQANGTLSGTVADKTGSVITGASVKITSQGTGLVREAKTDSSGHYLVPLLPVAFYTIHVEAQGFQTTEQKDVRLQVDEQREIDFALNPASVTEKVEVSATEVAVETSNATLGQVITSEEVADLPLNGRSFVQLATLTPGTTQSTSPISFFTSAASSEAATRGAFSLSVGGSREQSTDWLLDGNDNNQLDEGGIAIFSDIDDIQEFKVLTYNYSAEYGERAGPTVLVTTKSGSNAIHGTLFEFFRNTVLDAATPFVDATPQYNLNQFGGSVGGPIQKDKTFFFLDYQAKKKRQGIPFTGLVPTQAMMNDDFTLDPYGLDPRGPNNPNGFGNLVNPYSNTPFYCVPGTTTPEPVNPSNGSQTAGTVCNIIPQAIINPSGLVNSKGVQEGLGQALVNLYPVANVQGASGYNYALVPVRRLDEGTGDIRVDHNFSSKDSIFARFSYDQANSFVPGGSPGFAEQNPFGSTQNISNHGRNTMISETHVFSARSINELSVGFNRIFNHILSFGTGSCEATNLLGPGNGIPGANLDTICHAPGVPAGLDQSNKECVSCGLTSNQLSGYYSVGDRAYAPYQGGTNVYSAWDNFDMIRGKHDIRIGMTFRANEMNILTNAYQDGYNFYGGTATGDSMADLLLGQYSFAAHDQTFLGAETGRRWKLFRPYVQDDWRVTPDLTVNLGLGWALATPETEVANRQSNFDLASGKFFLPTGSIESSGCSICVASDARVGIQFDKTALEPRIGLSWKVLGMQSTVLRAGYAIYHDSAWNQGGQGLWQNWPFFYESDLFGPCTSYTTAASAGCTLAAGYPVVTTPQPIGNYAGTIQSQNRNFKQGMVQQYNLNIEHQLPENVVLTVGYAGTRSTHILVSQVNENLTSPSACGTPGYTLGCGITSLPFPNGGNANVIDSNNSIGDARYDSLQIKAETKNARHGLYALIGYTWSRNFDSGMPDGLGTNVGAIYWPLPGTSRLDWGLSQLNLNNSFTASVLYDLPFGKGKAFGSNWSGPVNAVLGNWEANTIVKATSGFPLFVVDSNNQSGSFLYYNFLSVNRPDEVGNPNVGGPEGGRTDCPAQVHTIQNWFNPCAFAHAPAGELGTAARAPVYGPRYVNVDFSAIKNIPLRFREGMSVQFRAEFFNLFNHPHYYLLGFAGVGEQDISTTSSLGKITQTLNDSRVAQFALKLNF
jgi:hypothetical protein